MMRHSFYFYDLETSGVNPREARIMQFAGQRTDMDLEPIGDPDNMLVRLADDVIPDPEAILVTGITPQQTQLEGITEAEFLDYFNSSIATPGTIFVGFNAVRFDDEFMRYTLYRNFYDAYEWQWKDDRGRWDLLDVVRMTRALRPEGIKWPVDATGRPTNRLELLASINKLDHANAHDALSDVNATIELARLLKTKQPRLFDYLLSNRSKKSLKQFISKNSQFVYSSGKYASEYEKTTVVNVLAPHPKKDGVLVYDLRYDPSQFLELSAEELAKAWQWKPHDSEELRLPIKLLQYNRCPAVAPMSVLDKPSQERLGIDMQTIASHAKKLTQATHWPKRLYDALNLLDTAQQTRLLSDPKNVDGQLYDDFFDDYDRKLLTEVRQATTEEFEAFVPKFHDDRLRQLLPLYKARNFPRSLSPEERKEWDAHKHAKLFAGGTNSRLAKYFARLEVLREQYKGSVSKQHILEDLLLYGQSLMPSDTED